MWAELTVDYACAAESHPEDRPCIQAANRLAPGDDYPPPLSSGPSTPSIGDWPLDDCDSRGPKSVDLFSNAGESSVSTVDESPACRQSPAKKLPVPISIALGQTPTPTRAFKRTPMDLSSIPRVQAGSEAPQQLATITGIQESSPSYRRGPRPQQRSLVPEGSTILAFIVSVDDPVGGQPLGNGELLMYDECNAAMVCSTVLLFSTGLYVIHKTTGRIHSYAWSPFTVVKHGLEHDRLCAESSIPSRIAENSSLSFISIRIPALHKSLVFAKEGLNAEAGVKSWIADIAHALCIFKKSFFPPFAISVEPRSAYPDTTRRIMAGYLLTGERGNRAQISTVYCELQAPKGNQGALILYESERCEQRLGAIPITSETLFFEYEGVDCSSFELADYDFCALSVEERMLWLWAIRNVLANLQNGEPDPTSDDLRIMREAVVERLLHQELLEAASRLCDSEGVRRIHTTTLQPRAISGGEGSAAPDMPSWGIVRPAPIRLTAMGLGANSTRSNSADMDTDDITGDWIRKWADMDESLQGPFRKAEGLLHALEPHSPDSVGEPTPKFARPPSSTPGPIIRATSPNSGMHTFLPRPRFPDDKALCEAEVIDVPVESALSRTKQAASHDTVRV